MMHPGNLTPLFHNDQTIASEQAKEPTKEVSAIVNELSKSWKHHTESKSSEATPDGHEPENDLEALAKCGKFPYKPSYLFLQMYSDVVQTLNKDPFNNLVAPSLVGSSGTIPLSIVSIIPDIMRHYAAVIVEAKHEVFLATNYWENSHSAQIVSDSLRELSKRCLNEGRTVVVKVMYDRGTPTQVVKNHVDVAPKNWGAKEVGLPTADEIKGLSMQVINYHRPPLGTFHAKYLVVDRRIACLNSNNIQDRPNVEMMTHLEGPIVESFYDMALFSWWNALNPQLPLLSKPHNYDGAQYKFGEDNEWLKYIKSGDFGVPNDDAAREQQLAAGLVGATKGLQEGEEDNYSPHIIHLKHDPVPIAMVNRRPKGTPGHDRVHHVPQNAAWLAAFKFAKKSIFIQTPTFNASPVIEATIDACKRGVEVTLYLDLGFNDLGEMIPFQGGTNEVVINQMYTTLNKESKAENLKVYWYTTRDHEEPVSATAKQRNCHVKFMCVDDQVAIQGNGNQDTQSWFHSQEVNVMVDSPQLVREWYDGINRNQNTRKFGLVSSEDGVWRSKDGQVVQSSGTKSTGLLGGLKGVSGAIARVRGTGGF